MSPPLKNMADDGGALAAAASLPIRQHTDAIVKAVRAHQVVVVIGETGSGKTTQLSQVRMSWGGRVNALRSVVFDAVVFADLNLFHSPTDPAGGWAGPRRSNCRHAAAPRGAYKSKGEGRRCAFVVVAVVVAPPRRLAPPAAAAASPAKRRRPDKRTIPKPTHRRP